MWVQMKIERLDESDGMVWNGMIWNGMIWNGLTAILQNKSRREFVRNENV